MPTRIKIKIIVPITIRKVVKIMTPLINKNSFALFSGSLINWSQGFLCMFTPLLK